MSADTTTPATDVPAGQAPATICPYCDRPFRTERLGALHLGVSHADELTDDEREAYEQAYTEETDDLFTFHVKITLGLLVTYFLFTYIYAIVWSA